MSIGDRIRRRSVLIGLALEIMLALGIAVFARRDLGVGSFPVLQLGIGGLGGVLLANVLARGHGGCSLSLLGEPSTIAKASILSVTGIAEEIMWRGFAFAELSRAFSMSIGAIAIMTTIGFALVHLPTQGWRGVRSHLITGSAFTACRVVFGGILAAMILHACYNTIVVGFDAARRKSVMVHG